MWIRPIGEINGIIDSIFNIPPELFVYMVLCFLLWLLDLCDFLYIILISSTVSKLEDINTAVQPVTFLSSIGFMVVMFSMNAGSMDNILMQLALAFRSPHRWQCSQELLWSTVPRYELTPFSIGILVASTFGTEFSPQRSTV